jgi:large subunit ribosomal protein L21
MEKYAVVQIGPFQYTLEEGKVYSVPKFNNEVGKKIELDSVLALMDGSNFEVGTPTVKGAKVVLNIIEIEKGTKIRTMVYKAKSRYRKRHGFRPQLTKFKVESIGKGGAATAEAKPKKAAVKKAEK